MLAHEEVVDHEPWYEYDDGYNYDLCEWYDDEYYIDESWDSVGEYTYEEGEEASYDTNCIDEEWEWYRIQKGKGKGRKGKWGQR